MDITWHGCSCFRITERGHTTVLTDPFSADLDLTQRGINADLVTLSQPEAGGNRDDIRGDKYVVSAPGEYEIGELFVTGIPLHVQPGESAPVQRNIAYHFEYPNGLNFLHLGALHQPPNHALIEQFDAVHALLLPIGGSLSSGQLADLIGMIEPNFVVPMHSAGLDEAAFDAALDACQKAIGIPSLARQVTLRISASSLGEGTKLVRLQPAA